ncbi:MULTISPECIES: hypothetical protein [unclassified Saccharicrinis]|uniref:hypothetical protein n=1 Tax=unclassified Saccharicrinis TaxID=2646859 RepID=UPI003D32E552
MNIRNSHPEFLQNTAPFVGVSELADSSVNLAVRPHSTPQDYWEVYFDVYEQGKIALDEGGITIPFPSVDVPFDKKSGRRLNKI